jgi:hypothetical protein
VNLDEFLQDCQATQQQGVAEVAQIREMFGELLDLLRELMDILAPPDENDGEIKILRCP